MEPTVTRTATTGDGGCDADAAPDGEDGGGDSDASSTAENDAVGERARAARDEQVQRACSRLDARDELTPDRREAVEALADRLVERLVAAPARSVEGADAAATAADHADSDAAATAAVLRALGEE